MSDAGVNKRKLEESNEPEEKRSKQSSADTVDQDLQFLKQTITQEILESLSPKVEQLENKVRQLEEKIATMDKPDKSVDQIKDLADRAPSQSIKLLEPLVKAIPALKAAKSLLHDYNAGEITDSDNLRLSTPLNSFAGNNTAAKTPTPPMTSLSTPKHVFGAPTAFGSTFSFSMNKSNNVFNSLPSTRSSETTAGNGKEKDKPKLTSSFGANTKFNNAFEKSLKKKSFLDGEDELKANNLESQDKEKTASSGEQYKQIDLEPIEDVKTGEENEVSLFSTTAKMFELDLADISEGWKERGIGPLHLNKSKIDHKQIRLVMRSKGLLRVILNMKITASTSLFKGYDASLSPGKFLRINSINKDNHPAQFMLKVSNQEIRDQLYDKIEELKKTSSSNKASKNGTK